MKDYERRTGRTFDLSRPELFSEKIVWYKLFYEHPDLPNILDKYLFKDYIREKLGPGRTAPLYGMWTSVRDLKRDWDSLPDAFVLKSNCSANSNNLRIIRNKADTDPHKLFREVRRWLDPINTDHNRLRRVYASITPRIIAEKLLEGADGQLMNYKVQCFGGKPEFIVCLSDWFLTDMAVSFYDTAWNKMPKIYNKGENVDFEKPPHLQQMLEISAKLSQGFPQIRVDFYEAEDGLYIGELTLYSGFWPEDEDWDRKLGVKFILPDTKRT